MEAMNAVRDTIYRATLFLDEQQWDEWLDLCDENFVYDIKAWSPEINYDMTYLHADRKELESLIKLLPKHNTDHSPLTRHTSIYSVRLDPDGTSASAVSSVVIFQHLLDGTNSHVDAGESRLFLVGKYYDKLVVEDGRARFTARELRLENRRLDKGSHWPL